VGAHGNSGGKENILRGDGIGNYEKKISRENVLVTGVELLQSTNTQSL
jgi:hypothetical protein